MPSDPRRCALRATAALLVALALAFLPHPVRAGDLAAIVNERQGTDEISIQRLRLIYGGYKRTWSDGTPITLLLPEAGTPAMDALVTKVFKKQSESDVSHYYLGLVFQQKLAKEPPKLSAAQAIAAVRADPGGIAIVDRGELAGTTGVRVLPLPDL